MSESELGVLRVAIVGAGRLGIALGSALQQAGLELVAASSRSAEGQSRAAARLGVAVFSHPREVVGQDPELIVVCTPDDAVHSVVRELAEAIAPLAGRPTIVHTSGSVSLEALDPAARLGCEVLALHPLMTVTADAPASVLQGAAAAITASTMPARTLGHALAHAAEMIPFDLADERRALYHAAAALAANATVTLLESAESLARAAGAPEAVARYGMARLASMAIARVEAVGATAALTGPIARGDVGTVAAQLDAIEQYAHERSDLFRAAGEATVALAMTAGRIDIDTARRIDGLLSSHHESRSM